MIIKKATYAFAAAAALAVGTQASIAAADGCQADFNIPTSLSGQGCSGNGKSGTAIASSTSAGAKVTYQVRLNAGNSATGLILKADGTRTKRTGDGLNCVVAQDNGIDGNFGPLQTCFPSPANSGQKIRLIVT